MSLSPQAFLIRSRFCLVAFNLFLGENDRTPAARKTMAPQPPGADSSHSRMRARRLSVTRGLVLGQLGPERLSILMPAPAILDSMCTTTSREYEYLWEWWLSG